MATTYTKQQRLRAKTDSLTLATIGFEPSLHGGGMVFQGPVTKGERQEIAEFMVEWIRRRTERLKDEEAAEQ